MVHRPSNGWLNFRIIIAFIGITAGLMVGIYFIEKKNFHVIVWGFISAVIAFFAMMLHIFFKKSILHRYVRNLPAIIIAGAVGQVIGAAAMIVYIVLGAVYKDDLKDLSSTLYVPAVWGFMTWKWSFVIFWYGRQYRWIILEEALIPVGDDYDGDRGSVDVKPPEGAPVLSA